MENPLTPRRVKRLIWDIETSPNVGFFWRAGYDQNISHDSIIKERKIITIAYKWEDEARTHVLCWDRNQDDKAMLREFLKVANEADELIAHYGDRFDVPWFRTRCLIHGFEPLPAWKTIDTKAWASKYYYFNSNKLDYIGKVLGLGQKIETKFDLWVDIVLKKCPVALAKMVRYNARDVDLLQGVFNRLKFCVKPKTHAGVLAGGDRWTCPMTGSRNVHLSKIRVTSSGIKQYQMQNNEQGNYYSINGIQYAAYLKSKAGKKAPSRK